MKTSQKIIKYLALALALFLIVTIIFSIMAGLYGIYQVFNFKIEPRVIKYKEKSCVKTKNIKSLDIKLDYGNLEIIKGEAFKMESSYKNVTCINNYGKVTIRMNNKFNFKNKRVSLKVYIPSNVKLDEIKAENNFGKTNIEYLNAKKVDLDFEAGKTKIKDIVSDSTNIDIETGLFEVENGTMKNVNFDSGVGKSEITSRIIGTSKFDTGIGSLSLNLIGNSNNYKIMVDKGIGNVKIDGVSTNDNSVNGNGNNIIDINSGIGEIYVNYIKDVED